MPQRVRFIMTKKERSPRSATQTIAAQTVDVPTNGEGNPQAKMSPDTAQKYMIVCADQMQHSVLAFMCSAAVLYIVAAYGTGAAKPDMDAVDAMIKKVTAERNVKTAMAYRYAQYARKLSQKLIEWNKMGGAVRDILTATEAQGATMGLLAWLKATKEVSSFNSLMIVTDQEEKWTPTEAAAAKAAAEQAKSSIGKAKAARVLNARAIDRIASNPKVLSAAVTRVMKESTDEAIDAIVTGITKLTDVEALQRISEACLAQLAVAQSLPPAEALKNKAERTTNNVRH